MGIPLETVVVNVKGFLDVRGLLAMDESIESGYQHITYETIIKSSAESEAIRTLADMVETYCPLLDTLRRPIQVDGRLILNGQPLDMELKNAA